MRIALTAVSAGLLAALAFSAPVRAQTDAGPGVIARQIQDGCVRRGETPTVCACGVGIAYAKLEPAAFALIPQIDPLIDERDRLKQLTGLASVASSSGMSVQQVQTAYETIRGNRATVRAVCTPLGAR